MASTPIMSSGLRFYDTATRSVREFEPRTPGRVSMYVCGPTVYDSPHLGHGRTALVFDAIRRYLCWRGLAVTYVSNITDIEDRIIDRAAERGTTEPEIARRYETEYWEQMDRLGVLPPDEMPHATGFVPQMLSLIAELVASGHAYVIEDQGVYFQVGTFDRYGALSHRSLEQLLRDAGARVAIDEEKRSPVDFALWKAAKPGEPTWDSPWGPGRPGWHIECSAMSLEILGEGFDIHAGGDDLVFPHHENEIAQAEAAGHPFARYWMHSGMVMVGGEKMSKSLGNFRTLQDAIDAHDPRAFRLRVLQAHYRRPMEIDDASLRAAGEAVARLDGLVQRARGEALPDVEPGDDGAFREAMDDDFNTPEALGVIFELVRRAHGALDRGQRDEAAEAVAAVRDLSGALGLELRDRPEAGDEEAAEVEALIAERAAARERRDWPEADRIRDELRRRGVVLEDTSRGTVWRRETGRG